MTVRFRLPPVVAGTLVALVACTSDGTNDDIAVCTQQGGHWRGSTSCKSAYCDFGFNADPSLGPASAEPEPEVDASTEESGDD